MNDIRSLFIENPVTADFFNMLVGEHISSGTSRDVYEYAGGDMVIKFEQPGTFQNFTEWETWLTVQGTDYEGWFAPCHFMSPCGRVLVQTYVEPLPEDKSIMDYVIQDLPKWFDDLTDDNWGLLDGSIVCRDYGLNHMRKLGLESGA